MAFSNLIESKGRVDGEIDDLSEKIVKDLCREGSEKEGVIVGLCEMSDTIGGDFLWRGGNSSNVKEGGVSGDEII